MCSEVKYLFLLLLLVSSCSPYRRLEGIRTGKVGMTLSVPDEEPVDDVQENSVIIDSIRGELSDGPIIMNAIRDSETGEMVATDVIKASRVTARFRNVAERAGYVGISFDISVPSGMYDSKWQLKVKPFMRMMDDTLPLDAVYITGRNYREKQLRGYERYQAFLSSIITDTADFVRIHQLEVFLERHFPDTYAMKRDSSFISEPMAENVFGVTQRDALLHYTKKLKWKMNEMRKGRVDRMYAKYVKDPMPKEGIRLDTVLVDGAGDFIYRYEHVFRSRPGLRKVIVSFDGSLYESGEHILDLPFPDELTFYISSLSTLADNTDRYRMVVLERKVYDNTKALIDFRQGSSEIDTLLGCNASELRRVLACVDDVFEKEEFELDSLVIVASCSPEGTYASNKKLSESRSASVMKYLSGHVPEEWRDSLRTSSLPENWEQLRKLVLNDTLMSPETKGEIRRLIDGMVDPDKTERALSRMKEYKYMREKLYPQLRCVRFDFHMHRVGMVKDTIHTTELDSVYMAGVQALRNLDYKEALRLLRPYRDFNSALAFMSADYNHSALDVLNSLDDSDPKVCYLKALVLVRLEQLDEAMKYFELGTAYDPSLEHRANLDPEMYVLVRKRQTLLNTKCYE